MRKKQKEFFVFFAFFNSQEKLLFNNLKQTYLNILELLKNNSIEHYANLRPAELSTQEILELFNLLNEQRL